jgi:integrase
VAVEKITMRTVTALAPGSYVADAVVQGFGVRRQKDGAYYYLRYRRNGVQYMRSIGRHGSPWTPDTARAKAKQLLGLAVGGDDPFAKPVPAEAFGAEVERYLRKQQAALKPRTYVELERHLSRDCAALARLRLTEIDQRTIALRLAEVETASGPTARNRVRSSLSAFFNWAVREGLLDTNPVIGTARADERGSRDRVLTQAELAELWAALPQGDFGEIVRLLALTGQRREEIGALRWAEVDLGRGMIVLAPERTKNLRQHEVPLSAQARAILERQRKRKGRDFVFGVGEAGFSGWSKSKERLDQTLLAKRRERDRKAKPLPSWRIHDLRRTAATGMAELGVQPHIIEAVLNHVSGHKAGVAGVYNRARYESEMRYALKKWADHVEALIVGPRKQPIPIGLMERAFAVARGSKIVPEVDLANLARQLTPLKRA